MTDRLLQQQPMETLEGLGFGRSEEPDTELHWMTGPPITTPELVIESWKKATAAREATKAQN